VPDWFWIQSVVFPILGMGMGAFFLYGTYRVVMRAIDRKHEREMAGRSALSAEELQQLHGRLETLDDMSLRVQDLEERLDFAERVLTRDRDRGQLGRGERS
jgi:hypothetical protein